MREFALRSIFAFAGASEEITCARIFAVVSSRSISILLGDSSTVYLYRSLSGNSEDLGWAIYNEEMCQDLCWDLGVEV